MDTLFSYSYEFIDYLEGVPMKYFFVGIPEYPFHWHKEAELLFVLKGSIKVLFADRSRILSPGEMIIIDRYQAHAFDGLGSDNLIAILQFDTDLCSQQEETPHRFLSDMNEFRKANPAGFENLQRALAQLGREFLLKRRGYQLALRSWFYRILAILIRQVRQRSEHEPIALENEIHRMRSILQYVDAHFTEPLYLEDLAGELGLSPSRISHIFTETVGMSFGTYVAHKRLQKAKQLLGSTPHTILRIALECGLSNEASLYRLFKHHEQMTPNAYRRNGTSIKTPELPENPVYHYVGSDQIIEAIRPYLTSDIY
jgi:xylan 1,4-beta-xylosidase